MILRLSQVLTEEVIQALQQAGFDVVRIGEAPAWMERVVSLPAELYRMKRTED